MWDALWNDETIDRTDELEWEPVEMDDEDDDLELELNADEVVSLDEWLAHE